MTRAIPCVPHDLFARRRPSHIPNVPCRIPISRPWEMTKQLEHRYFLIDQCVNEARRYSSAIKLPVISSVTSGECSTWSPPLPPAIKTNRNEAAKFSSALDSQAIQTPTTSTPAPFLHKYPSVQNAQAVHAQSPSHANYHGCQRSYDRESVASSHPMSHQRHASTEYTTSQQASPSIFQSRTSSSAPTYVTDNQTLSPKSTYQSPGYTPMAMPAPQASQRPQWVSPRKTQHRQQQQQQQQRQQQQRHQKKRSVASPPVQRSETRVAGGITPTAHFTVVNEVYASDLSTHRAYVYTLMPTANGGLRYQATQ